MAEQVANIARTMENIGRIRGQGLANQGAIWGGTLASLGQIPQQIQQAKAQEQEQQIRQQEMQIRQSQVDQVTRQQQTEALWNNAIANSLTPDNSIDFEKLSPVVAQHPELVPHWQGLQGHLLDAQEKAAKVLEAQNKVQEAQAAHAAALANAADAAPDPETKAATLLVGLVQGGQSGAIDKQLAKQTVARITSEAGTPDPQQVATIIAQMKQLSAADLEKRAQATKNMAEAAKAGSGHAPLMNVPPENTVFDPTSKEPLFTAPARTPQPKERVPAATGSFEDYVKRTYGDDPTPAQIIKARKDYGQADDRPRVGSATPTQTPTITPGTAEYKVAQDLASGKLSFGQFRTLTAYGRDTGKKMAIYQTASELNPEFNPTQFELGLKMAGNPQFRNRLVAINALGPVIDQVEGLVQQVGNGDMPALNKILQGAKFHLGSRPVTNFRQLQVLLGEEVGNALGVGTGSDLKTRLGLDLVNPNLGPKQFTDTMQQLRTVLDARKSEILKQMGIYADAAGGGNTKPPVNGAPPVGAKVRSYNPATGKFE